MLLAKCVMPVPIPDYPRRSSDSVCSTSSDSSQDSANSSLCRKSTCLCPIVFTVPNIPPYNSDNETNYSYQGYETTQCEDDYDAESYHSEDEEVQLNEEYEPVTDVDPSVNDTDSDAVSFASGILVISDGDSRRFEEDFFADESDYLLESANTSTEDEPDKWPCITCGINNRPFMRYCLKCWQERKEWYPERPARKKRRKSRPKKERRSKDSKISSASDGLASKSFNQIEGCSLDRLPSDLLGSCCSQDSGVVCSIDSKITSSQDSTVSFLQNSEVVSTINLKVSSPESGMADSQDLKIVSRDSIGDCSQHMVGSSKRYSDIDEPPHKYRKMYGPKDLQQISRKFRKFASTSTGHKWVKSSRADDLRERIKTIEEDSETEKFIRKFHKFASSYSGRRWLQSSGGGPEFLKNLENLSSDSGSDESDRNCSICWCKTANASIIHGSISHLGVCYSCAKRLKISNSRCPACRRKIDRITKNCYV